MNFELDTELVRAFLQTHAQTILTWLVAGLLMMLLARFELRRAVRKPRGAIAPTCGIRNNNFFKHGPRHSASLNS